MGAYKGFTLIELLTSLSILIIGIIITVPLYQSLSVKKHLEVSTNQMLTAINLARSVAIQSRQITTLCASKDGKQCDGDWLEGMLLFIDKQGSGSYRDGDTRIRIYNKINQKILLTSTRGNNFLRIAPTGLLIGGQTRSFLFCPVNKDFKLAKKIVISSIGRVRVVNGKECGSF